MNSYYISEMDFMSLMTKAYKAYSKDLNAKYKGKSTNKEAMKQKNEEFAVFSKRFTELQNQIFKAE